MQTATANVDTIVQQLRREQPDPNPETAKLVPLREVMLGDVRPIMLIFFLITGSDESQSAAVGGALQMVLRFSP